MELGWVKVPNWECLCSSKTRIVLFCIRGCDQNGWKEAEHVSHVEEIDEN